MKICLECLVLCSVLSFVASAKQLSLKPQTNSSGSPTVAGPATDSPVATPPKNVPLYRLRSSGGATCILLQTDAVIEINFQSHSQTERGDGYILDNAAVQGDCDDDSEATMILTWPGYNLTWKFAKSPDGVRWYVNLIQLRISKDQSKYHYIKVPGKTVTLYQDENLYLTPVSRSYSCKSEKRIDLMPLNEDDAKYVNGTIIFLSLRLQPFMFKWDDFGAPFDCDSQGGFRDETAPIAVGSTLAVAVLMTVTGYGIFRYFKIKKVQYNTME